MKVLHDANIAHRDIKPDNIMILYDSSSRLIDMETSCLLNELRKGYVGTDEYAAPEVYACKMNKERSYLPGPVDIYNLGTYLFAMYFKKLPFTSKEARQAAYEGKWSEFEHIHRISFAGLDPSLVELILMCMNPNPLHRPTIDDVIQSDWVTANSA